MARQKQSEPSLGLDRRQLLAATAAVTAAGIVPNAKAAGTTNSVQAATVTKAWVSESPALNVCASTARKIQEIAQRNRIREQAGLPLLSVPSELRKIKNVEIAAAFERFSPQQDKRSGMKSWPRAASEGRTELETHRFDGGIRLSSAGQQNSSGTVLG